MEVFCTKEQEMNCFCSHGEMGGKKMRALKNVDTPV